MHHYFKQKSRLITAIMVVIAVCLSFGLTYYNFIVEEFKSDVEVAKAGAADNVTGYAWSENIGWISFNCTNPGAGGCGFDYGVHINPATYNFSGYAWSSNVGWISFQESNTPDNTIVTNNCDPSCDPTSGCTACVNGGNIFGWAKVLSLGNDGWIKLSDTVAPAYGVTIDILGTGNFSGWAWNGNNNSAGIGWINFNCGDYGTCQGGGTNDGEYCPVLGNGLCADGGDCVDTCLNFSDYKVNVPTAVFNSPPTASNLSAPHWNYTSACDVLGALRAWLRWDFVDIDVGDTQHAYRIIVHNETDGITVLDTGKCTAVGVCSDFCGSNLGGALCTIGAAIEQYSLDNTILSYNKSYSWSIEVWDDFDVQSGPVAFDISAGHQLIGGEDDGVDTTFTTYKNEFPDVNNPTKFPDDPSVGEEVQFTDTSQIYEGVGAGGLANCDAVKCAWEWTVPGDATIRGGVNTVQNPIITFNSSGFQTIKLKVTDIAHNYSCEEEFAGVVNVKSELPSWREVK